MHLLDIFYYCTYIATLHKWCQRDLEMKWRTAAWPWVTEAKETCQNNFFFWVTMRKFIWIHTHSHLGRRTYHGSFFISTADSVSALLMQSYLFFRSFVRRDLWWCRRQNSESVIVCEWWLTLPTFADQNLKI